MLPFESDPEVLERLYEHFAYLRGHPLRVKALPDTFCVGTLDMADQLVFVLADADEGLPYRPRFDFLTPEENASFTGYRQLRPVLPWPQPLINLHTAEDGSLRTGGVYEVEVLTRPVGSAQLWWGGGTGVVFEAYVKDPLRSACDHTAMTALWERCEALLQEHGATRVWTHDRDPEFADAWYQAFLRGRGYRPLPARTGGRGAVCKLLALSD